MRKKTFLIKQGQFWSLLNLLKLTFGAPRYQEELVIYFDDAVRGKATLTRSGLDWSWSDEGAAINDRYPRETHSVHTDLHDLKEKFLLLCQRHGTKGHISVSPLFSFPTKEGSLQVELRPKSFVGEIISVVAPAGYFDAELNQRRYTQFIDETLNPYITGGLADAIKAVQHDPEPILLSDIGDVPMLCTTILDFCRRNGIMNPFQKHATYREILTSKDNNFGVYEEIFKHVTGDDLLSTKRRAQLPSRLAHDVSIIIPCYNSEHTIPLVLASIAHQRLPHEVLSRLEVVLVDDCSVVSAADAVRPADYPFDLQILRLSANHGISHARNLGVAHARHEVLVFLDSDVVLSRDYLADHLLRNLIIDNAVFVSFKENVKPSDARVTLAGIGAGLECPDYAKDLRVFKKIEPHAIGSYEVNKVTQVRILEMTNYFKDFHGARHFGVYDLSCMITGHNFSVKRDLVLRSSPFSRQFKGWGMEDVLFGLKMISVGAFIIPVLSSGVYHIDHPPRSGSAAAKEQEYRRNTKLIDDILDSVVA